MKRAILCFLLPATLCITANAQVAINTDGSVPDGSSMLDIKSASKGILVPRLTAAQRDAISNPAKGLLVFCTDNNQFYANKGTPAATDWQVISSQWKSNGSSIYFDDGNVGVGTSNPAARLHVHDAAGKNPMIMITPMTSSSGDSATLLLAEDNDATFGMYWMYDGNGNHMELWGKNYSTRYGPHLIVHRDNGSMAIGSAVIPSGYKLAVSGSALFNQVGMNTDNSTPDPSAVLDVKSDSKGFLPPRMTKTQRDVIPSPAAGLIIFNTTTFMVNVYTGTYWTNLDGSPSDVWKCGQPLVDGSQVYSTVFIGTQCWMAQNLNKGIRINGSQNQSNNGVYEKHCYDNNEANCNIYGGLYQWDEMMQYETTQGGQGICPAGWHLPTDAEWTELSNFLGGDLVAGGKLKETGINHWATPNTGATNSSGFTALAGGSQIVGNFYYLTTRATFWTSTDHSTMPTVSWYRQFFYDNVLVSRSHSTKQNSYSCRCLQD